MGTEILKGKVPYADIWDHKGPVLYFIQALGAVGGTANKGTNILFLMQLLSNFFTTFLMFKTYRILNPKGEKRFLFLFIIVCFCAVYSLTMESGNLSEEWCLPMLAGSFYLFAKYITDSRNRPEHPPIYAFLHGIGIGLTTMIRANNIFPVLAGLIVIGICLIINKRFGNIAKNIAAGAAGILVIFLPLFLWFYSHGALSDMIYAVFTFNLSYTQTRTFVAYQGKEFITRYLPVAVTVIIQVLYLIKKRSFRLPDLIMPASLLTAVWMMMSTNVYLHYFTTFLPVMAFILISASDRMGKPEVSLLLCLCLWFGYQNVNRVEDLLSLHRQRQMFDAAENIPLEERDSVIAVNMPPEIYLNYGLEPVSRFCAYQHIHLNYVPEFRAEFLETIRTNPPLWVLAFCSGETNIPEVREIIDSRYQYRFDQSGICYYHLNGNN